jgi:hypothetical protein
MLAVDRGSTLASFNIWHDDNQDGTSTEWIEPGNPYIPAAGLTAGAHTITIESTASRAGVLRYTLYASTDVTQPAGISPTGVAGKITVTPGQRAHLQFTLQQASKVMLAVSQHNTLRSFNIWHDDNQDGTSTEWVDPSDPYIPATNLAAGSHTITIEPIGTAAGTLVYTLYASTDLIQTTDVSGGGAKGAVTVTPGQRAHLQFTLQHASKVMLAVEEGSTLSSFNIWHDNKQDGTSTEWVGPGNPYAPESTLSAGTHTITIEPIGTAAGTLEYALSSPAG